MLNLSDVKTNYLDSEGVKATIYRNARFLEGTTRIKPFKEEMKNSNGIILCVDNNNNITSGQISLYDISNGLQCICF